MKTRHWRPPIVKQEGKTTGFMGVKEGRGQNYQTESKQWNLKKKKGSQANFKKECKQMEENAPNQKDERFLM